MPSPTPLTHARPKATRIQSALAGARIVSPPACFTLVISGSSGSGWGEEVCAFLEVGLALLVSPSLSRHAPSGSARTSVTPIRAVTRADGRVSTNLASSIAVTEVPTTVPAQVSDLVDLAHLARPVGVDHEMGRVIRRLFFCLECDMQTVGRPHGRA